MLIEDHPDFELAADYGCENDECMLCHEKAYGVLYFWCGDPECCAPPTGFYCREHLLEAYA